jgi:VanZ family protein
MSRVALWVPVAAYMAIIFWLSSQSVLPGIEFMPEWLAFDWLQHAATFGGLALVTLRATAGGRWGGVGAATVVIAWVVATLYGATDEWHQYYVPGRFTEARDLAADAIGAAIALSGAFLWSIIRRSP